MRLPRFDDVSRWATRAAGSSAAFVVMVALTAVWLASGPYFRFNADWNFIANTSTTIVTTLLVFLIQGSQNRDGKATHLKLDEIIRALRGADNRLLIVEELPEGELDRLIDYYQKLREAKGKTRSPEIRHEPGELPRHAGQGSPPAGR